MLAEEDRELVKGIGRLESVADGLGSQVLHEGRGWEAESGHYAIEAVGVKIPVDDGESFCRGQGEG